MTYSDAELANNGNEARCNLRHDFARKLQNIYNLVFKVNFWTFNQIGSHCFYL